MFFRDYKKIKDNIYSKEIITKFIINNSAIYKYIKFNYMLTIIRQ